MRWTPILNFAGLTRRMKSEPLFGLVSVLIFLPSSLKTTFETCLPLTRALNALATQPVLPARLALPGTTFLPSTNWYWETDALGRLLAELPEELASTAEPPLSIIAKARNVATRRGLRLPRARAERAEPAIARRFSSSNSIPEAS